MSESKRFKRDLTVLEQLPNELFIEIFSYLNGVDTIYAFSQLNNRIQCLLIQYVNKFDFRSTSNAKFDYDTKYHDIHQWQSLCLFDDGETSGQIKLFCQLYPLHQYISQLQSLSALNMTYTYAKELVSFDRLVTLKIGNLCGEMVPSLELPSLQRLVVTSCKHTTWMMKFQSLQNLQYTVKYNCHHNHVLTLPTTLKQLKVLCAEKTDGDMMRKSISQLSQLTKFTLYNNGCDSSMSNGEAWKELIQSSLPLLQTFQFCFCFRSEGNILNESQQVVVSFSTPFYLFEKQWFVRCDYDCHYPAIITLYSLPFAFPEMPINVTSYDTSMSTLIADDKDETKYESYEKIKTLLFNKRCQMPYRGFLKSNIVQLVLQADPPASWLFLLSNLRYVEFGRNSSMSSNEFNHFLANTPKLRSLTVSVCSLSVLTDKFVNNSVCDQLSQRIQSLTISSHYSNSGEPGIVSVRILSSLVQIFREKCEHLSLGLAAHPSTVLSILRRMRQLRSLHIRYRPWSRTSQNTAAS